LITCDPSVRAARRHELQKDLLRIPDLPSAPQVLTEIWTVLGSETSTAKRLAEVISTDPALSARILRLANSAYFALLQPVSEVSAACVVLGFDTVKSLAIGVTALGAIGRSVRADFDLDAFWRHSVGVGSVAQRIARRLGLPQPGTAFCGGILHDLGRLVLVALSARRYQEISRLVGEGTLREAEAAGLGADHQEIGAWVGERWRFPEELVAGMAHHHDPWEAKTHVDWCALAYLANWIASRQGYPPAPETALEPGEAPDPRALEILRVTEAILAEVSREADGDSGRVEAFVEAARS
jgi:HD-like signal output (HDOD) protein